MNDFLRRKLEADKEKAKGTLSFALALAETLDIPAQKRQQALIISSVPSRRTQAQDCTVTIPPSRG